MRKQSTLLTLDNKRAILEMLQKGAKPSSLMKEFNHGKATISVIKDKSRILYSLHLHTGNIDWQQNTPYA